MAASSASKLFCVGTQRIRHDTAEQVHPYRRASGLILPITNWILKETTRQLADWQKISPDYEELMVSVNISGKHLSNDDLVYEVENVLADIEDRTAFPKARDHRKLGDGKCRTHDQRSPQSEGDRRPAEHRRFWYRIFFARVICIGCRSTRSRSIARSSRPSANTAKILRYCRRSSRSQRT